MFPGKPLGFVIFIKIHVIISAYLFSFGDVSVPNLYIMGSFHLVVNYWTSLVPLASVSQLLTLLPQGSQGIPRPAPRQGTGIGMMLREMNAAAALLEQ